MFRVGEDLVRHALLTPVQEAVQEFPVRDVSASRLDGAAGQKLSQVHLIELQTALVQHPQKLIMCHLVENHFYSQKQQMMMVSVALLNRIYTH